MMLSGRAIGAALVLALAGAACGSSGDPEPRATEAAENGATTAGAALRARLGALLGEHVSLAASATGAALGGRSGEYDAAAAVLLGRNARDLAAVIRSVYGTEAADAFLPLWRRHIGFFVDYTQGVAARDRAKQRKAVDDLLAYTQEFGAFLASANPNLTKAAVASLVEEHVLTLKAVVDAQARGDLAGAYASVVEAIDHMDMIAAALAAAIVTQFPDRF